MTVSITTKRVQYDTDNSTVLFSVTFPFDASSELVVTLRNITTDAETALVETTDYTVAGGSGAVGSITTVATHDTGSEIHIKRDTVEDQDADFDTGQSLDPGALEDSLDKLTRRVQDLQEQLNRCLKIPKTDATTAVVELVGSVSRADNFLFFDAITGDPEMAAAISDTLIASAFWTAVLTDANLAAAQASLGIVDEGGGTFSGAVDMEAELDLQAVSTLITGYDTGVHAINNTPTDNILRIVRTASDDYELEIYSGGTARQMWHVADFATAPTFLTGSSGEYVSAETTIAAVSTHTFAHGLGAIPRLVQVVLVCNTTDQGYSVDDEIPLAGNMTRHNVDQGLTAAADATNIVVTTADALQAVNKTTFDTEVLTLASWDFVVRAWA